MAPSIEEHSYKNLSKCARWRWDRVFLLLPKTCGATYGRKLSQPLMDMCKSEMGTNSLVFMIVFFAEITILVILTRLSSSQKWEIEIVWKIVKCAHIPNQLYFRGNLSLQSWASAPVYLSTAVFFLRPLTAILFQGKPKMSAVTIAELKKSTRKDTFYCQVFIHQVVDELKYVVGDKTDQIVLNLENNESFTKHMNVGKYYRLVNPKIVDDCLVLEKFKPLQIAPFDYLALKRKYKNMAASTSSTVQPPKTFDDFAELQPGALVPALTVKVVNVSPVKQGKYSEYVTVTAKDVQGKKNFLTLFGAFTKQVESDNVYIFKNLAVQNFKGASGYNHLSTKALSSIVKSHTYDAMFKDVINGDGKHKVLILGHEQPYMYLSCPECGKAKYYDGGNICNFCGKNIEGKEPTKDFNVMLQVQIIDQAGSSAQSEDVKEVLLFRRQLDMTLVEHTLEEINQKLMDLHFKEVELEYYVVEGKWKALNLKF